MTEEQADIVILYLESIRMLLAVCALVSTFIFGLCLLRMVLLGKATKSFW